MRIEAFCTLDEMRRFLIESTCKNFIPERFLRDRKVFPERRGKNGIIYVEAEKKEDLSEIRDITFVKVRNVLGIIYTSKSGRSRLKWRAIVRDVGKLTGEASSNTLVNLITAGIRNIQAAKAEEGTEERSEEEGEAQS